MHEGVLRTFAGRIEARASATATEEERLALRKLGRRLREVHKELGQYDELVGRLVPPRRRLAGSAQSTARCCRCLLPNAVAAVTASLVASRTC